MENVWGLESEDMVEIPAVSSQDSACVPESQVSATNS